MKKPTPKPKGKGARSPGPGARPPAGSKAKPAAPKAAGRKAGAILAKAAKPKPARAARPAAKAAAAGPRAPRPAEETPRRRRAAGEEPERAILRSAQLAGAAPGVGPGADPGGVAKLDIGPAGRAEKPVRHIPWGYGQDRVTAAAVDPDRLFVYWEVTDEAMAVAREALGAAGRQAALHLRVHDVTNILFDGTNAHSSFDHRVERGDRQWFFDIHRPTSSAVVEVGMRAPDGGFARISRSGRVDFPRKDPAPWTEPEWMTVIASTGEVRHAGTGVPWRGDEGGPGGAAPGGGPAGFERFGIWQLRQTPDEHLALLRDILGEAWNRVEWVEEWGEDWFRREGQVSWHGPVEVTTWTAGPFDHPVEVSPPERSDWRGQAFAYSVGGVTHVVYGPWQVVIRNVGAHGGHAVVSRWEVYRSWVTEAGREGRRVPLQAGLRPGASEQLGGASERMWLAGSELRLGGASERWRIGASELRLGGASELLLQGASQRMLRGASERMRAGASEWRLGGASERTLGGGSEGRLGGASEQSAGGGEGRLGGASEQSAGGGREGRLGGGAGETPVRPTGEAPLPFPPLPDDSQDEG
jgi:hypothetical protein